MFFVCYFSVRDVAKCFMELVASDVSGQVMVVSPRGSGLVTELPVNVDDVLKLVPQTI
jgi:hypothetical protein